MATSEIKVGPPGGALGDAGQVVARADKTGAQVVTQGHAHMHEATVRGNVFSMALSATTTGAAAGQLVGAAAAAATQFALFNPVSSGYNLSIYRFGFITTAGTPAAGMVMHGIFTGGVPTLAANGTIRNNLVNGRSSVATGYALAAGTALTGGTVGPVVLCSAEFGSSATAAATQTVNTLTLAEGSVVIPPGTGWLPLLPAAGTGWLTGFSVTWEEIPV